MAIWRHKKGWRYQFQVDGTRYARAGFATRSEALSAQEQHKKELKAKKPQTQTGMVCLGAMNEYLDFCQRRYSKKTFKEKSYVFRSLLSFVGANREIGDVTARDITAYLQTRPSNANWNKHRKNICAFFQWAFKHGLVAVNPCICVAALPQQPGRKQIPTQEDVVKLILAAGELRTFFLALYSLAGRVNEINRLRWEDVNFEKRTVTLWTRKGDGNYRAQEKAINDELYKELRRLYDKRSGEWVFPNPRTGLPFVDRRKQIKRICFDAGIPYRGFHSIRHHVASLLADTHKVSLPTIQKMLGHTRATTTERYIQSLGEGVRDAADLLQIFTTKPDPLTYAPHQTKKEPGD
jgi:integrase